MDHSETQAQDTRNLSLDIYILYVGGCSGQKGGVSKMAEVEVDGPSLICVTQQLGSFFPSLQSCKTQCISHILRQKSPKDDR